MTITVPIYKRKWLPWIEFWKITRFPKTCTRGQKHHLRSITVKILMNWTNLWINCHISSKSRFHSTCTRKHTKRSIFSMTSLFHSSLGSAHCSNHMSYLKTSTCSLRVTRLQVCISWVMASVTTYCPNIRTLVTSGSILATTLASLTSSEASSRTMTSTTMTGLQERTNFWDSALSPLTTTHPYSYCTFQTWTECRMSSWRHTRKWFRKHTLNLKLHLNTSLKP